MTADLAILYEHPKWFEPLFAALGRRGIGFEAIRATDHHYDPADRSIPAPLVFNRVSMSGFLRDADHAIFYGQALLDQWQANGARIVNGPQVLAIDASKARQLALLARLGIAAPRTRIVHRPADLFAASQGMDFPLLVKANIGGSGAGIARYDSAEQLAGAVADGSVPESIDKVLLLQDYAPARGGVITRIETLGRRYLYAIDVETGGDSFDLCPADACIATPGRAAIRMTKGEPAPELVREAERIAQACGMDVGGVELLIDDRDGAARFYDINALSNFVANPLGVLGFDPHEQLVDYLENALACREAA